MEEGKIIDVPSVGIEEPIEELTEEAYLASLTKELEMFEKNKESAIKRLEHYNIQLKRIERIWEIQMKPGNFRPTQPKMIFEKEEEYWSLMEQDQWDKIRMERIQQKGTILQLENSIKDFDIQIKDKKALIKKAGDVKDE